MRDRKSVVLRSVGADLTVNPRAVTVTADAKSNTYGDADPALTYQLTNGSLAFSDARSEERRVEVRRGGPDGQPAGGDGDGRREEQDLRRCGSGADLSLDERLAGVQRC